MTRPLVFTVLLAAAVLRARTTDAASLVVDRTDDDPTATACTAAPNDCSLRGAILTANALGVGQSPEASDIAVPAGTYALSQSSGCTFVAPNCNLGSCTFNNSQVALCLTATITVHGDGSGTTIVDAGSNDSVALVSAGAVVELRDVTLTHGFGRSRFGLPVVSGGAILNEGTLTLTDARVTASHSDTLGGGMYNAADLTLTRTRVDQNTAEEGGALWSDHGTATVTIVDSTIADNTSDVFDAGAVWVRGNTVIRGSTFSGNGALAGRGGALFARGDPVQATLAITNSTFSGNHAKKAGGAIYLDSGLTTHLASVTIAGNSAGDDTVPSGGDGGGIAIAGDATSIHDTLVAGNTTFGGQRPDCVTFTPLTSQGYNLVGDLDVDCQIQGDTTGDVTGVDAKLAPLTDNGGLTKTLALLAGSPAIDAGDPNGCTDADGAVLATDQRGTPRALDGDGIAGARCDIGAFELGAGLAIAKILPTEGGNAGPLIVILRGSGFQSGAEVRLERDGETDVVGAGTTVDASGEILMTTLDLTDKPLGTWDVVVENPDDSSVRSADAFTVATPRPADLWVDVSGPAVVRVAKSKTPTPIRYVLLYGNRGNEDAFAVPLLFGVPEAVTITPLFTIAQPPHQSGKQVIKDFGGFYQQVVVGDPSERELPLLLPIVPAGFSGALEVTVDVPGGASDPVPLDLGHGDPLVDVGGPRPDAVATLVAGAREKAERLFDYTIPPSLDPAIADYIATQLATIVDAGRAALVASFGTDPQPYSLSQLAYDAAAFGMIWSSIHPPALAAGGGAIAVAAASVDDLACVCGVIPKNISAICCDGCACTSEALKDPEPPETCGLEDIKKGKCPIPKNTRECKEIGFEVVAGKDAQGDIVLSCASNRKCAFPNAFAPSLCIRFPIKPLASRDPNDKSGPVGAGAARYIASDVPLHYVIEFENSPDATAPSAQVVVTDALDPALVDLSTLALGPIDFGDHVVIPPPGLTSFATDVDLRPATNLIVRIDAALAADTHVLRWQLASLDPATMQPPTDPLAGFLPPDVDPPEGTGHVTFTVAVAGGVTSGTAIPNQAEIVFDANDPIDTPVWSNTIDDTPPTSAVTSVTPTAACAKTLAVAWSGADADSGVATFDVEVSEDGGPFVPWTSSGETSGTFAGKWGKSYAFRTIAHDAAGNVEASAAPASAPVAIDDCGPHDLAVTKIKTKAVKLGKRPAVTVPVVVTIQNRGAVTETIPDAAALASAVTVSVDALTAGCPSPPVALHAGKPQKALPLILAPKQSLAVVFDATFDCAVDKAKGAGHEDFAVTAAVHQDALGGVDAHAADDTCPRAGVKPPPPDPVSPKIKEKGCGAAQVSGVLGGPVLVDVTAP